MKGSRCAGTVAATWLVLAGWAGAQTRPLQTEEATTAPRGTSVLEIGVEAIRDEPNFVTGRLRDRWAGPILRFVYSPSDNVEIDVEWTARVGQRADPDFGSVSDWGDVALRAKLRLVDEGEARPAIGARFGVLLPETSFGNGLGPNALRMSVQLLATKTIGATTLSGNAGLALHDEVYRPHEQRDFLAYGVAAAGAPEPAAGGGRRMVGTGGERDAGRGCPQRAACGRAPGAGDWRADGALRRGLVDADGTWGLTAGVEPPVPLAGPPGPERAAPRPIPAELANEGPCLGRRRGGRIRGGCASAAMRIAPDGAAAAAEAVGGECERFDIAGSHRIPETGQAPRRLRPRTR